MAAPMMEALARIDAESKKNLQRSVRSSLAGIASAARRDPAIFCQYVLRTERGGARIRQAATHNQWQKLASSYRYLVIWSHVDGGKTNQLAIGRVLFELGRNPNLRVAICSKTTRLASKILQVIQRYIERSVELHDVFPHLIPARDRSQPWNTMALTVERPVLAKDPSVQAVGAIDGNMIGSRVDLLVCDDIIDGENTRTGTQREHTLSWIRGTAMGRLSDDHRVLVLGNAWHPEDALHRLQREHGFAGFRFPVRDEQGRLTWPEHWTHERIERARQVMGPLEFSRALLCVARDDETSRFKREYLDKALANGVGKRLVSTSGELVQELVTEGVITADVATSALAAESVRRMTGDPAQVTALMSQTGIWFYTGVDLAVSRSEAADLTCFFTIAVLPDGSRRVCEIKAGRFSAPEILAHIRDIYTRFGSTFIIENNAAQDYILQMLRSSTAIPLVPFTTGRQKAHPELGIENLAVEFLNGKWVIPCNVDGTRPREVDEWVGEMYRYEPPPAHTGDRLMASWFAREGHRHVEQRGGGGGGVRAYVLGV